MKFDEEKEREYQVWKAKVLKCADQEMELYNCIPSGVREYDSIVWPDILKVQAEQDTLRDAAPQEFESRFINEML